MANNETPAQKASALTKMFRERLQAVVESTGASCKSPLAAEWILSSLDDMSYKATDKVLRENWILFYMLYRVSNYSWVDRKEDLPHMFTYSQRAHLVNVAYHSRNWSVEYFERMLANASDKLRKS